METKDITAFCGPFTVGMEKNKVKTLLSWSPSPAQPRSQQGGFNCTNAKLGEACVCVWVMSPGPSMLLLRWAWGKTCQASSFRSHRHFVWTARPQSQGHVLLGAARAGRPRAPISALCLRACQPFALKLEQAQPPPPPIEDDSLVWFIARPRPRSEVFVRALDILGCMCVCV
jgi:hypothetical protein